MKMTERAALAVENRRTGCNCCQAVLLAYADEVGLTEEQLMQLGRAFAVGMGGMQATCGALIGAGMILGLKGGAPAQARRLHEVFKNACGATICRELKGVSTGQVLCSCEDCVEKAVLALETL